MHFDTDDFYWLPTDPPFARRRPPIGRLLMLGRALDGADSWVLSGSVDKWGVPLVSRFDLAIFLSLSTEVRLARLRARETERYGEARLASGGDRHDLHKDFLKWAAQYENEPTIGRSRARQERFLARLSCPVLRLDGDRPPGAQTEKCVSFLRRHRLLDD